MFTIGSQHDTLMWRALLTLILLAAFARPTTVYQLGLPAITDMDELMFELGAIRMITGGELNPDWFGHPAATTMYLLALIAVGVFSFGVITGRFADVDGLIAAVYNNPGVLVLPQRIGIALFAVLGIALAYRLASRLFDRPTGLATAAILAVSPVQIQYSQIVRSDMIATTFMLAAMLCAVAYARGGTVRALAGGVLCVALAITTKWPFVLAFLSLAGALVVRWQGGLESGRRTLMLTAAEAIGTLAAMVAISLFLLIEWNTVVANLRGELQPYHLGATGGGLLDNALWYASGPFQLGVAGVVLAAIGAGMAVQSREFVAITLVPVPVMFVLACTTIRTVWIDIRKQGWADRSRLRRDVPLLPWVTRPERRIP